MIQNAVSIFHLSSFSLSILVPSGNKWKIIITLQPVADRKRERERERERARDRTGGGFFVD